MTDISGWNTVPSAPTAPPAASAPADGSGRERSTTPPPSDTPTFGAGEVAYALSLTDGVARMQAEKFLQVAPDFVTDQIAALGASSLVARGELLIEGDVLQPRGALRLFIGVLQNAVRWTEIGLVNDDGVEAALYLQSSELSIFLQPAAMSTWVMVVKAPEVADAAMLEQIVTSNVPRHPSGTAYFGTEVAGSEKTHFFVRPSASGDGRWDLADVEAPGDGLAEGVDTAALRDRLRTLVELPAA
ncbi:hypothetical protein [Herbiconiux sp.]|uniref:hypothetical protein n=1 Tax=Herbiconiux sp. TaxID=1871186 RepID=UPI0025BBF053|nr:hypothetical protein [Herbiconiux sp.]